MRKIILKIVYYLLDKLDLSGSYGDLIYNLEKGDYKNSYEIIKFFEKNKIKMEMR